MTYLGWKTRRELFRNINGGLWLGDLFTITCKVCNHRYWAFGDMDDLGGSDCQEIHLCPYCYELGLNKHLLEK